MILINKVTPFANETFSVLSTTNSPGNMGLPGGQLEKGLNSKKGKAYVAGNSGWFNNTIFQFRNNISTWTVNFGSQTQPNTEHAGTMGQNHGYLAGGYQGGGYNQNAHTDKVFHNTDTVVQIADAKDDLKRFRVFLNCMIKDIMRMINEFIFNLVVVFLISLVDDIKVFTSFLIVVKSSEI